MNCNMRNITAYFQQNNSIIEPKSNALSEKVKTTSGNRQSDHCTCNTKSENSALCLWHSETNENKKRKSVKPTNVTPKGKVKRKLHIVDSNDSDFEENESSRKKILTRRSAKFRRNGTITDSTDSESGSEKKESFSVRTLRNVLVQDCMNTSRRNKVKHIGLKVEESEDSDLDILSRTNKLSKRSIPETESRNSLLNYFNKADTTFNKDEPNIDDSPVNCLKRVKVVVQVHSPPKARLNLTNLFNVKENLSPVVKIFRADVNSFNFDDAMIVRTGPTTNSKSTLNKQITRKTNKKLLKSDDSDSFDVFSTKKTKLFHIVDSEAEATDSNETDVECVDSLPESVKNSESTSLEDIRARRISSWKKESSKVTDVTTPLTIVHPWKMRVQFVPGSKLRMAKKSKSVPDDFTKIEFTQSDKKVSNVAIEKTFFVSSTLDEAEIEKSNEDIITPKKLAPLFCKENEKRKCTITDDKIESRKIFLQSGLPEVFLKRIDEQKNITEGLCTLYTFPKNNHIQQKSDSFVWSLEDVNNLKIKHLVNQEVDVKFDSSSSLIYEKVELVTIIKNIENFAFQNELTALKKSEPDVNVAGLYSSIKRLNEVAENIDICWTDKYKPTTYKDLIGNTNAVMKLKEWIESHKRIKIRLSDDEGSSEEFIDSDDSSHESTRKNNVAILVGPSGCGKTCAVYMLANELGFKVLEVNAGCNRNGKRLLDELLEATQSHRVKRASIFESEKKVKKKKRKETPREKKTMSLILIEDADILFESHDEGFLSALSTLAAQSKRPLIFVVNNIKYPHLNKYNNAENLILNFSYPSRSLVNVWLQLIALAEGMKLSDHLLMYLFQVAKLDLRKSLLQLQMLISSKMCSSKLNGERLFYNEWFSKIASIRKSYRASKGPIIAKTNDLFSPNKGSEAFQSNNESYKQVGDEAIRLNVKSNRESMDRSVKFLENVAFLGLLKNVEDELTFPQANYCARGFNDTYSSDLYTDICSFLRNNFFSSYVSVEPPFSFPQYYNVIRKNLKIESVHHGALTHLKSGPNDTYSKFCDYLPMIRSITRIDQEKQRGCRKRSNRYFSYLKSVNIYLNDQELKFLRDSLI